MAKRKRPDVVHGEPDLRTARIAVEGDDDFLAGLDKARERLENVVAPLVTAPGPGRATISFKGQVAGLAPDWTKQSAAVYALQYLYRLLDAIESGDSVAAAFHGVCFGDANSVVSLERISPRGLFKTLFDGVQRHAGRSRGGSKTRFDSPENAKLLDDATVVHGRNVSQIVRFLNKNRPDGERKFGREAVKNELARRAAIAGK